MRVFSDIQLRCLGIRFGLLFALFLLIEKVGETEEPVVFDCQIEETVLESVFFWNKQL